MSSEKDPEHIGKALVGFASNNIFPDSERLSAAPVEEPVILAAYGALNDAKIALQSDIREVSRDIAPNVQTWITTAKALQADIETSRALASKIVKQAEEDKDHNDSELQKAHVEFLEKEVQFNSEVNEALLYIKEVEVSLRHAEELAHQKKYLESLEALSSSTAVLERLSKSVATKRVYTLLKLKGDAAKKSIHEQFLSSWNSLVKVDPAGIFTIEQSGDHDRLHLEEGVVLLKAFDELDQAAISLWNHLDDAIVKPRTEIGKRSLCSLKINENSIVIKQTPPDGTIESLLQDLESFTVFLINKIPEEFVKAFAKIMMQPLSVRIRELWLDRAIPPSLDDVGQYQNSLSRVREFAEKIDKHDWPGTDSLYDWCRNAPRNWLHNRREIEAANIRQQLELGLGDTHEAEHVETHEISKEASQDIASAGVVVSDEWDAAWDSDDNDDHGQGANGNGPSGASDTLQQQSQGSIPPGLGSPKDQDEANNNHDDDADDAWGWGDDPTESTDIDVQPEDAKAESPIAQNSNRNRAVTMKEMYRISSIPQPVYDSITNICEDGAKLAKTDNSPIASAASGLLTLPTQILTMYRALSRHHYSQDESGNMLLYNDCTWLCDKLLEFKTQWETREDIAIRMRGSLKLDPEIQRIQNFSKRAYREELNSQRTAISDLLGGTQNFLQINREEDQEIAIDSATSHICSTAARWKPILPYSVWASAVGALANSLASKIILDVLDLSALDADAAERTAVLISKVETLDHLFIPAGIDIKTDSDAVRYAETPKFADQWMKMKFLSQVLQSNLKDIRMLWFESDLSLYFTKEEVLDLIELSFVDSPQSKQLKREIRDSTVSQ
ncbi:hypothetical protein B0O99DRAFT_616160 [Bisporella sp. PMI_857]|nr:hypothetical protein B0O99DRAFT_616160 [Bisporella sp. PMI_857]